MWPSIVKTDSYEYQLHKLSGDKYLTNRSEFYNQALLTVHNYHTSSHAKKYSEIGFLTQSEHLHKFLNFPDPEIIYFSAPYVLVFSSNGSISLLKGGYITGVPFILENPFFQLKIPHTTQEIRLGGIESLQITHVNIHHKAILPDKFKIAPVRENIWITTGGVIDNQPVNTVCLIKYHIKKNWFSVGYAFCEGFYPPRYDHAVVPCKQGVFIYGGFNDYEILGDFYLLKFDKVDKKGEFGEKYRVVVVKYQTGGLNSAIRSHALVLCGNNFYCFGGNAKKNKDAIIRKMSLSSLIWKECESNSSILWLHHNRAEFIQNPMVFGNLILISYPTAKQILVYDVRLKIISSISISFPCMNYGRWFGLYFFANNINIINWNHGDDEIKLCKLAPSSFYYIKPVPFSVHSISSLLNLAFNNQHMSNIIISTEEGELYAHTLILYARYEDSKKLLENLNGNKIKIQKKFSLKTTNEAFYYLYTDSLPENSNLKNLRDFAFYYSMKNLKDLCSLSCSGQFLVNNTENLDKSITKLWEKCIKIEKHAKKKNKNLDIKGIETDFIISSGQIEAPCHKFILYLYSGYVRNLIQFSQNTSLLTIENFSPKAVEIAIKYCYGSVKISNDALSEVLALSQYLDMPGLFLYCQEKISLMVTQANLISLYEMSISLNAEYLICFIEDYAKYIGFKPLPESTLPQERLHHLSELRYSYKKETLCKGMSEDQIIDKFMSQGIPELPSLNEKTPESLNESKFINAEMEHLKLFLKSSNNEKVFKDLVKPNNESEDDEDDEDDTNVKGKFNRFSGLDFK
ncbi:hypothetical protein SteCoe_5185 [Stentor coeruleus]|uniref:BTB domain-containing protein n=1 Tax=Stentor coeruleus TaxID=5963 RepID=A0A1R2CSZ6_9CILI|nr:hypothetical protein SteCoe_5185 [Stentor coeruleus]